MNDNIDNQNRQTYQYQPGEFDQPQAPSTAAQDVSGTPSRQPRHRHGWVAILAIVLGSVLVLALIGVGVWSEVVRGSTKSFAETYRVAASEQVLIDLEVGDLDIEFTAGVTDAQLDVSGHWQGGESPISMTNGDGGAIVIEHHERTPWFGRGNNELTGVLTLPAELEGQVHLQTNVAVGRLSVHGELARLDAKVDVGDLLLENRVQDAKVEVSVGRVVFEQGGGTVEAHTDAGDLQLLGDFDAVTAGSSVGSIDVAGAVTESITVNIDAGDGHIQLESPLPGRADLETSVGDLTIVLVDEPFQLNASKNIRESAVAAGFDIDGGSASPQLTVSTEFGDVDFGTAP